jgi:RNA polymerase sigma-70 factor (ECF subfamily)
MKVPAVAMTLSFPSPRESGTSDDPAVDSSAQAVPQAGRTASELYRTYGPVVYRRCLRLLKDPDAAQDATQEVFLKLVRDMPRLQERETVLPWLYRVAMNYCLNERRNATRRGGDRGDDVDPELDLASTESADIYPDRALAQSVLARFDTATQAIAIGVIVDGMDREEVAEALGVSRRTVARKLDRFLDNARKYIARSGPR